MASDRARMLEKARSEPVWPRPPLWSMALGVALAAFLLVYPFLFTTPFAHHLVILILLYALMAQSWNVVAGLSGHDQPRPRRCSSASAPTPPPCCS